VEELKEALLCTWNDIGPSIIENLVASTPDHIFQAIRKQGGQTKY
jgi:hypothetical protein